MGHPESSIHPTHPLHTKKETGPERNFTNLGLGPLFLSQLLNPILC